MRKLLKDNEAEALRILLKRIKIKFSSQTLKELKAHPHYPGLISFNYVLDNLKIENVALRASYEQMQNEFPKPLLVHINDNGGMYLVVDDIDEERVHFVNEKGKLESQPKDDFLRTWSGIAMLVDAEAKVKEEGYKLNVVKDAIHKIKLPLAITSLILAVFYAVYYTNNNIGIFDCLFLLTKVTGVIVSIPLMIQLIDKQNLYVKKLCNSKNPDSKVNCSSVLDSPAAYFLGIFSWSEIGFVYFSTLFLYILLFQGHSLDLIVPLAFMAGLYPFYSIYYQWKIARQWCRLCLLIQSVLVADILIGASFIHYHSFSIEQITGKSYVGLILIFSILASIYAFLKPVLVEWKIYKDQFPKLNRIKLDTEVFSFLLKRGRSINNTTGITPLQFGNPGGEHTITIVSNPTCNPCIEMHKKLFKLLRKKGNVLVNEIFLSDRNKEDSAYQIANFMTKLYFSVGSAQAKVALEEYYMRYSGDLDRWKRKYDNPLFNRVDSETIVTQHINWCLERQMTSTPIIFFNNYQLPEGYTIEDLDYLID